mmetsp:Transcript_11704/g.47256  ORF Transcript_11704/g.47256 Transcript_11704/m.47256 type:complete len:218 (-) Transcript_11704:561-1214(-)
MASFSSSASVSTSRSPRGLLAGPSAGAGASSWPWLFMPALAASLPATRLCTASPLRNVGLSRCCGAQASLPSRPSPLPSVLARDGRREFSMANPNASCVTDGIDNFRSGSVTSRSLFLVARSSFSAEWRESWRRCSSLRSALSSARLASGGAVAGGSVRVRWFLRLVSLLRRATCTLGGCLAGRSMVARDAWRALRRSRSSWAELLSIFALPRKRRA